MSSCQGELTEQEFHVTAVDKDGNTLIDGPVTTLRNGFMDLWLPRNRQIDLTIKGLNREARGPIGTFHTSKTCVTTFRLQ